MRVNWRDMGPDELGYVYEGLLELVPQITKDGRSFAFASADQSRGHVRKTTGSYYTPDELVQLLLTSALNPVVKHTVGAHPDRAADALLELGDRRSRVRVGTLPPRRRAPARRSRRAHPVDRHAHAG